MKKTDQYRPPHDATAHPDKQSAVRSTRILKAFAGWSAVACIVGATIGTVISMISSFNTIATSGELGSTASISLTINQQMLLGMVLIPIGFAAFITWLLCGWRLRLRSVD